MAEIVPTETPVVWVNGSHPSVPNGEPGYYTLDGIEDPNDHTNVSLGKRVEWVADGDGPEGHFEYQEDGEE